MAETTTKINIIGNKRKGTAARLTTFSNGWTVETWWNRSARSWVIQIKDNDGNQRGTFDLDPSGPAQYVGSSDSALICHFAANDLVMKEFGGAK